MFRAPIAAVCALAIWLLAVAVADAAQPVHTARGQLVVLHDQGAIDDATFQRDKDIYDAAVKAAGHLSGRRRVELRSVIATVNSIAAQGRLNAQRLPMAFLTLDRNRAWWTTGRLLRYGERVLFSGSDLVWESYPGQGIQIQWLATFGRANGLFTGGHRYDDRLRKLLAQAQGLAAPRAGGLAWEYWFSFDGGRPPWVSSLAQGTALQAFGRAGVRLADPALFDTGRAAMGIFSQPPPEGVRLVTPAGAHYLIYSFAPGLHVLNAFIQSLNGLYDFGKFANDDTARTLFSDGEAEARLEVPKYNTGTWSLYSQTRESDLGYHKLLTGFLQGLCTRLTEEKAKPEGPTQTGGAQAGVPPRAVPDPALYCDTAASFTKDLTTAPVLSLKAFTPSTPRARRRVQVPFELSKISTVTTRVTFHGAVVGGYTSRLGRGRHAIAFTPRKRGSYAVSVRAVDLAGNAAYKSGAVPVAAAKRP